MPSECKNQRVEPHNKTTFNLEVKQTSRLRRLIPNLGHMEGHESLQGSCGVPVSSLGPPALTDDALRAAVRTHLR